MSKTPLVLKFKNKPETVSRTTFWEPAPAGECRYRIVGTFRTNILCYSCYLSNRHTVRKKVLS